MNDVLIECFRAATETLNFTTAAQMIHISQPSFSRNIAMLEEEMGFKLFWRSKQNGIRLTPAGSTLYNGLFSIEKQYFELIEKARQISRGDEGKLVIGILNGICLDSQTFFHITRFKEEFPQVEVELKSCSMLDLEKNLLKGGCDISFMMANLIKNKKDILYEKVFSIPTFYAVPNSMNLDPSKEYSLLDLKDQTFVFSGEYPEANEFILKQCQQLGFEPKVKVAPDNESKLLWADMGEGVTAVTMDQYIRNSSHVTLVKIKEAGNLDFAICWNKDNYNPAIALFYSLIEEVMKTY